jgi:hypothetical protein
MAIIRLDEAAASCGLSLKRLIYPVALALQVIMP